MNNLLPKIGSRILHLLLAASLLTGFLLPSTALAAGIAPSGGGSFTVGQTFTVTVRASGATFDSLQGTISVSGSATSIVSFSAGSATWLPGKSPANGKQFVGIVSPTSSVTVATIRLKGVKEGSGSVSVSGARLAKSGSEVGSSGGSTSFTIGRAPTPPGGVSVSSSTHPDQNTSYEATTVELSWEAPSNGASGYSAVFDEVADTTPPQTVSTTERTAKYEGVKVGTHYFHIRAQNGDGWSAPTHFKVTIKESVNSALETPTIASITLADDAKNDITAGTVTGLVIQGSGLAGYTIHLLQEPTLGLSAEKYPEPVADEKGEWRVAITDPVKAGFYKLIAQGEKDDVLTPASAAVYFELSVGQGGQVNIISADDETTAYKTAEAERVKVAAAHERRQKQITWGGSGLLLFLLIAGAFFLRKKGFFKKHPTPALQAKDSTKTIR